MNVIRRRRETKPKKAVRTARKAVKAWAIYRTVRRFTSCRIGFTVAGLVATALAAIFAKRRSSSTSDYIGAVPSPTPPPPDPDQVEHRYVETQQTGV